MEPVLPLIWAGVIATAVFLYVAMDGFDLGLGILFPAFQAKADRDVMVNTVAPVWDGNETWLVLGGAGLFAVFPLAYVTVLPALYMPLILMLLALVFRGVAFEMRFRAETLSGQLWWDRAFSWGSYAAAFNQGIALGALVQGIRVENRAYAGGWWDWLTPYSLFTGLALVVGYGLLGACWLIWKTEGTLQTRARHLARTLGWRHWPASGSFRWPCRSSTSRSASAGSISRPSCLPRPCRSLFWRWPGGSSARWTGARTWPRSCARSAFSFCPMPAWASRSGR
jgi:cytochrome d ubiquinol oxidase subunit II